MIDSFYLSVEFIRARRIRELDNWQLVGSRC